MSERNLRNANFYDLLDVPQAWRPPSFRSVDPSTDFYDLLDVPKSWRPKTHGDGAHLPRFLSTAPCDAASERRAPDHREPLHPVR